MAKQTIKRMGERPQFQVLRDRVSQIAAILTAIEYGADDCMCVAEIAQAIAGCNVLLGNATEKLELLDELEVNHA
ncbi:hypothetical protein J0A78_02105 [Providencia rettgeri]|uniref:hypothetical protein n=1 Tax=Providencia rettgeri TaxID=587 RepID=UPI0019D418B7|nr:hypothetical protein [Providencia rettgeri]MBN7843667.1 hypothetical protein [Providencia rettgeri]MBN7852730.1 hypothetical protein [Providencia rettgeri]MBN7861527.1 hypothetical protein [Providencia rettgeri]MBN7871612.1 hypothetical protein [Providencia rettgeri]MBN7896844.1 hypothetical protein [Providencia rettgeri]